MKTYLRFGAVAGALLTLATLFQVASAAAQQFEMFPERRIIAFAYQGADEEVLRPTAAKILTREGDAPGSWVYEWSQIGAFHETQAAEFAAAGRRAEASDTYIKAAIYYALAWFPSNYTPEERAAYRKHLEAYQKAGELFEVPLEIATVPYRDGNLVAYVHRPAGVEKPPLVIWTGGGDQFKANSYSAIRVLNEKGLAVASFDLPGFGESEAWRVEPSADDSHIAMLEYFIQRGDFDAARISFIGVSFGGYFAGRVAARNDPRIRSVVSMCPVVHQLFDAPAELYTELLATPERGSVIQLARIFGVEATGEALRAVLAPFSLQTQGLVGGGKTITTPLLVVNGTLDGLGPVSDMRLLYDSAVDADIWLMARGDHCALEYWPVMIPQLADWILEKNRDEG